MPDSSSLQSEIILSGLDFDPSEVVVIAEFNTSKKLYFLVKPKDLKLKKAEIQ